MCHSDKVAKKCYLRDDLTSVAASALDTIAMCTLEEGDSNPNPNNKAKTNSVECAVKPPPSRQSSDAGQPMVQFCSPETVNVGELGSSQPPRCESEGKGMTTKQKDVISHYNGPIASNEKVLTDHVRSLMKHDLTL